MQKKVRSFSFKYFFLFYIFLFSSFSYPQFRTQLFGTAAPGSIIIGAGEGIKSIIFEKKKINFDKTGWFVIGFDRDAKGKYQLKITYNDKKVETFDYELVQAEYEVQKISGLPKQMVAPPKKIRALIARQTKIISAEKKKLLTQNNAFFKTGFIEPVDSAEIKSVFGSGRVLNGIKKNPHNGIDYGADEGKPIKAAGDGIVILAEENFYYNGTFVMISHGLGLYTIYLHMSKLHVKRGDKVSKGDIIGEVGSTGRSTGPHLHFGLQLFNKRIDPMCLFQLGINPPQIKKEEL